MQENNMYEREIDLVQMVKYLWKRLWVIGIGAVIGFILVLGLQALTGREQLGEGEKTAYEKELDEYEANYAQLEMEIDNLEKSIDEQVTYNNESILMKINPYDEKSVSGQFYIDTDYQIVPELTYQNVDITTSVARAYQALASTGTLANYINAHLESPIKERYLNELINIEYLGDATLQVTVMHTSMEEAKEIYDLVIACMDENKKEFKKTIGDYNITLLNESDKAGVDLELKETQTTNLDTINVLKESLETKRESFNALVMPSQGTKATLLIVGAFLGAFCVLAVYVLLFLVNTTIKTEEEVTRMLGLPVLGTVPVMDGKKRQVITGKWCKSKRYSQYGKR